DVRAQAGTVAPQVDWLITNNWQLTVGANIKFGTGARKYDDNRSAIPYPSLSGSTGIPVGGSAGLGGFEPLGRFRSGPIGMAQEEDEAQITLRYRF
ncbi:MAG: DUF1302 domain-containing protein, partial [Gammaproteobacteria bacterium]|nr:DUF1302 domain-containing protein [Gammaproteobacteria bacterium]